MSGRTVLVAGATGALGLTIARKLAQRLALGRGDHVLATYRTPRPAALAALAALGCAAEPLDLSDAEASAARIAAADAAVLTPILTVSAPAARAALARGARRLVLFSSNNVSVAPEAPVYAALRAEEERLADAGGDWTLLRPTMIYGHPEDGNMSRLLRMARRWPLMPMAGSGRARQQPIHLDDLADLAAALTQGPEAAPILAAAGPDVVTLRALYEAVRRAAGRRPPILAVPTAALAGPVRVAAALRLPCPLTPAQVARLERDKLPPPDLAAPTAWRPAVTLEAGLACLAAELGAAGAAGAA